MKKSDFGEENNLKLNHMICSNVTKQKPDCFVPCDDNGILYKEWEIKRLIMKYMKWSA